MSFPYVGVPSYETVARRFSSTNNLQEYFNHKRLQESKDRSEYIETHEIGVPDPKD